MCWFLSATIRVNPRPDPQAIENKRSGKINQPEKTRNKMAQFTV
jgi:hypothetical protein